MRNSNTKAYYVNGVKLHQLEKHYGLFRTRAVLNTVFCSNINIKETIGNHECSSLARSLFDVSGSPNHGGDGKSDLVHAFCNSREGPWIAPWRDKLDVVGEGMAPWAPRPPRCRQPCVLIFVDALITRILTRQ